MFLECEKLSECMSSILAILSIVLGIIAIFQSIIYDKRSKKNLDDINFVLGMQIRMINLFEKNFRNVIRSQNKGKVYLSKDSLSLYKLSSFREKDVQDIMNIINTLAVKEVFKNKIYKFLQSEDRYVNVNFFGSAMAHGNIDINNIYENLLKYNIVFIVEYKL